MKRDIVISFGQPETTSDLTTTLFLEGKEDSTVRPSTLPPEVLARWKRECDAIRKMENAEGSGDAEDAGGK